MSPVEIILLVTCALLLAALAGAGLALRQLARRSRSLEQVVQDLREQVVELCRRESAREAAETASAADADVADWVITFDQPGPGEREQARPVPAQYAVSTALGEPLLKAAALSHGVRQALREEKRAHLAYQVRREYRRRRRAGRARARAPHTRTRGRMMS